MTFTNAKTGKIIYNYIHTLDYRGNPDTLYIDPSYTYDIKIHTTPPLIKRNVTFTAGKHNTVAVDAPQGYLNLQIDGITNYKNLQALVVNPETNEIINVQDFNDKQKYLVDDYTIEILTLPRLTQENINIVQDRTTTLQVQQPGKLNIVTRNNFVISIFQKKKGETLLVKNLNLKGNQDITVLQPGKYQLIYREAYVKESIKTKIIDFTIKSGEMKHINLK
jgi:Ca-activated chloride channel family protein